MPRIIIHAPKGANKGEAVKPLMVNGRKYPYSYEEETNLPDEAVSAARNSDLKVTFLDEAPAGSDAGEGGAGAGTEPGGKDAGPSDNPDDKGGDDFDAEDVIKGTVPEVEERIANLTREQLEAVKAAEEDREAPRTGVTGAVDKALAAFSDD